MKYLTAILKTFIILSTLLLFTSCAAKKELANLRQEHTVQEVKLDEQTQKTNKAVEERNALAKENNDLVEGNTELKNKLFAARESLNEIANQEPECPEAMTKGVVFKVQIGAYSERTINDQLTNTMNLDTEQKGDLQKTVVGQFRSFQKADRLNKQLRAMGVNDAWIVSYRDGKRVPQKDVMPN